MLALIIVGCVLLFFALILSLRVGFQADYSSQGLALYLKVACFRFRLCPGREKRPHAHKGREKAKRKTAERGEAAEQAPEKGRGPLKRFLELSGPILEALGRLRRKLRLERIRVDYAIGGKSDPAEAAIRYGIVSAGGGALFPLLNAAVTVRDWDVSLGVDFQSTESQVALAAEGSWRLGELVYILLAFVRSAIPAYRRPQTETQADKQPADLKEDVQNGRKASDR